ncbi:MAG: DUF4124 domain-containing protein [Gammaproteobacteria bacterium]
MRNSVVAASIFLGLMFGAGSAPAQTVKKWVDEEGVTHYSDQKPVDGDPGVKEIEVPEANVTPVDTEDANKRIQEQLKKMEQDRMAREQEAREKEEARALEEALEREELIPAEKKEKDNRGRRHRPGDTYPKPPPGPFPVPYPGL